MSTPKKYDLSRESTPEPWLAWLRGFIHGHFESGRPLSELPRNNEGFRGKVAIPSSRQVKNPIAGMPLAPPFRIGIDEQYNRLLILVEVGGLIGGGLIVKSAVPLYEYGLVVAVTEKGLDTVPE